MEVYFKSGTPGIVRMNRHQTPSKVAQFETVDRSERSARKGSCKETTTEDDCMRGWGGTGTLVARYAANS
jgi:hypothetical protein